ncbi:sensor domain-containing diguanylate cyclase [Sphingopyxis macrogoltabida]|uniref:sensor domain-containing diguanylate cyclase n=1 Tax=Sphingopyxis macrogoltabida TaxID=33050 RepID=UPI000AA2F9E8|nr:diguanylate cyclase [Sphingopyxis macrogoltabida]
MSWLVDKIAIALAGLIILLTACSPPMAAAPTTNIGSSCWAATSLSEDPVAAYKATRQWHCGNHEYSIEAERVLLRFEITQHNAPPRYLFSRRAALEAVHILSVEAGGAVHRKTIDADALINSRYGGFFKVGLPKLSQQTRQIIVAFDRPTHRMTLEQAYLTLEDDTQSPGQTRFLILLAGLVGMLLMPLIFNAAFYRILREPFVLWHSALAVSLVLTILISSGLSPILLGLPVMTLSWMATMTFGLSVAAGAMFTYSFVEPGCLHPKLRHSLPYCAGAAIFLSMFHAAFPFVARPVQSTIYTAGFAPILAIFIWSMIDALRRGSRAAKYQMVGWAPMVAVGLTRLVTGLLPSLESEDAMLLFYCGCVFEVMSTAMGVADRFMTLKKQRDRARTEAELLERLSERDSLTGLLNRRALEERYAEHRAEGFDTLAVLDLDHFKQINDTHGHVVGDAVLKAVATALQPTADVLAYRLGGEEFVLLLRSDNGFDLAERRRRAIPAMVAKAVSGLSGPVTASMGVSALASATLSEPGFRSQFERADKMLYQAKAAGRNSVKFDGVGKRKPSSGHPENRSGACPERLQTKILRDR